jgi:hypothetical protein
LKYEHFSKLNKNTNSEQKIKNKKEKEKRKIRRKHGHNVSNVLQSSRKKNISESITEQCAGANQTRPAHEAYHIGTPD